jgi:hypothetical protein
LISASEFVLWFKVQVLILKNSFLTYGRKQHWRPGKCSARNESQKETKQNPQIPLMELAVSHYTTKFVFLTHTH